MTLNYTMDFADGNSLRSFQLVAYTTNGPDSPIADPLDTRAASAATSLTLYGRRAPDYGEGIQENLLYLLDNFAGTSAPSYAIGGQLWFDRNTSDYNMRVFNTKKHEIIANAAPNVGNNAFVTIVGDHTSTFTGGQIRIIDAAGTDEQQPVLSSPAVLDGANTLIAITPTPTASVIGQYIGGWEYILQNNTGLLENLPANGFTISGLVDPISAQDAATKAYVDAATTISVLPDLTDVDSVMTPGIGDALIYNGAVWTNGTGATGSLPLAGGTMLGPINMSSNLITDLLDPVSAQDAATKNYVDTSITSVVSTIPNIISDLTDVTFTIPAALDDVLQFDGLVWKNVTKASFVAGLGFVIRSGDTMTGFLTLSADPTAALHAATKQYVDTEITNAVGASGDGVVNGGSFSIGNQELTLTRTNGLPTVSIPGFGVGIINSTDLTHTIESPRNLSGAPKRDLYWEQRYGADIAYPTVPINSMFTNISQTLGNAIRKPQRAIVAAPGTAEFDIGDGITGTFGALDFAYVPGYDNLNVSIAGVKQYADEHGFLEVNAVSPAVVVNPPFDIDEMWPGFPTGLSLAVTDYTFTIQLNAGTPSDTGPIVVTLNGANIQTMGGLVSQILLFVDANTSTFGGLSDAIPPFGVILENGNLTFFSSFPGVDSSVTLTDGGAGTPLFAAIVGGTDSGGNEYNYTIAAPTINGDGKRNDGIGINPPAPSTWAYREVGRVGRASNKFVFTAGSIPTATTPVEIKIDNVLSYNFSVQP